GYTNLRRYVIGTLSNTLVNGKSYCGKVYVNLSNLSPYKINQFGMYYDNGVLMGTQTVGCLSVLPVTPQVANNPAVMLDDSMNWMRVQGIFTANGTESRVTLGNFKDDANTIGIATGFPTQYLPSHYNIDDVSLIATSITAYAGSDATICLGDSQHLGRPQEVGLECLWYKPNNATPFASTSDIWFKPTTAGSYTMVQRMDNCAITWDTVNITVITDCSLLQPTIIKEIPNVFTPNGDGVNDTFMFEVVGATDVGFTVYNRWGLDVVGSSTALSHQTTNNKHQTTIQWNGRTTSGEQCSDGVYYYTLTYKLPNGDTESKKGFITLIR
ncbi:MAG: gliding motility-associated C-terminal domain-containing protein, partial [Ferruginibacter sp.]|nr:gliding motility-associated C-terminal domain-containing protein [Ferruginibacter sp.]